MIVTQNTRTPYVLRSLAPLCVSDVAAATGRGNLQPALARCAALSLLGRIVCAVDSASRANRVASNLDECERSPHQPEPVRRQFKKTQETNKDFGERVAFLKGYVPMVALFTIVHGLFILLLVFVFKVTGSVKPQDVYAATIWGAGVPLGMFVVDLFTLRHWPFTRLQNTVGTLALRILVTQFGIIFGMLATAITKSPWSVIAVFFLFRVLTDALVDWSKRTKGKLGLPNWFARMVAKKEKKSVEQVRAEFETAMKSDLEIGEGVLNAPFGEGTRIGK
jgi:Family of unknown function (DUF6498)